MRNEFKFLILLAIISGLLGYALYTATNSFLLLADTEITPLIKVKFPEKETPKETIIRVAESEGLNPTLTLFVADCESKLDPHFIRVNKNGSVDRGTFGINNKAHPEVSNNCAFDVSCSTKFFAKQVRKGKLKEWLSVRGFRLDIFEKYLIKKK